jgi:hypothetical protein
MKEVTRRFPSSEFRSRGAVKELNDGTVNDLCDLFGTSVVAAQSRFPGGISLPLDRAWAASDAK